MRRNGPIALRYGRVSQETGITYTPQYSRYPLVVRVSAVHTNPCTVALRVSLNASPGNWYSKRNEPTGVPGAISESRRLRSESRGRHRSFGPTRTRTQPEPPPEKFCTPKNSIPTKVAAPG